MMSGRRKKQQQLAGISSTGRNIPEFCKNETSFTVGFTPWHMSSSANTVTARSSFTRSVTMTLLGEENVVGVLASSWCVSETKTILQQR
jgi:hypothetical protein